MGMLSQNEHCVPWGKEEGPRYISKQSEQDRRNQVIQVKRRFREVIESESEHQSPERSSEECGSEWEGTPHLLSDVGTYPSEEFPPRCP